MLQIHGRLHFPKSLELMHSCQSPNPIVVSAQQAGVNPTQSGLFLLAHSLTLRLAQGTLIFQDPQLPERKQNC